MNTRQRFNAVLNFEKPEGRMPLIEWAAWWDATTDNWKEQGLPKELDADGILEHFGLDNLRSFWLGPDVGALGEPAYHGAPMISTMEEYQAAKKLMYNEQRVDEYIAHASQYADVHRRGKEALRFVNDGFFWGPRRMLGIEPHLYAFYDKPELMHAINSDLADYNIMCFEKFTKYFKPDFYGFGEDMSYNHGPMLSYDLFKEFLLPYYKKVIAVVKQLNIPVLIDSDGDITKMIPWMIEAGIEGVYPLERQAGVDINYIRECYPKFLMMGGYDKMVMKLGEEAMRAEFERILPVMKSGGYIPSVDHQTPPGVTYENFKIYVKLFKEYAQRAVEEWNE